jgi:decaprenylphospho-beta-D-erythro-pentofuranosid-2-ulose 2-reductase
MTYGRDRLMMVASPEQVAEKIHAAWARGADVVYVPWFWRVIMTMVKLMPERILKRLDL